MQKRVVRNTLIDIVIPVHRRMDLLEKCLSAIPKAADGLSYTIIIVDNGTPPAEKELYKDLRSDPNYIIVELTKNFGFPRTCNFGVKKGKSPLIFLLNSDVILEPESINKLVMVMDDPTIGVVGMKLTFPPQEDQLEVGINPEIRPPEKLQHIGLATNVRGEIIHAYLGWSADHPKVNRVREMYAVTGAALMTRRIIWRKAKGFNEEYGMGTYEDVDFCLAVRDIGYNIVVQPEASGIHYTGATAEGYQIPYPINHNRMLFLQRWGGKLNYTEWQTW